MADRPIPNWRWLLAAVAAIGVAVALIVIGPARATEAVGDAWRDWTTSLQAVAAGAPDRQLDLQRTQAGASSLLVVATGDEGEGEAFALLSRGPEGEVLLALLPPSLFDLLPGFGDFPLRSSMSFEGADLAQLTVANSLGVHIDGVLLLEPGDVTAGLGAGPALAVDLPTPLVTVEGDVETIVADSGPGLRSAETIEAVILTQGSGTPLEWLGRQAAVLEAMFEAIGADPVLVEAFAEHAGPVREVAQGLLAAAGEDDLQVTLVPVERQVVAGAEEGFTVDAAAAIDFVNQRLAHLALQPGERARVEVLNGNGQVQATRSVTQALVRNGYRVIGTDNADSFDYAQTLVISQGRDNAVAARRIVDLLGTGELRLELRAPSGVVDISIIVGHDIPSGEE